MHIPNVLDLLETIRKADKAAAELQTAQRRWQKADKSLQIANETLNLWADQAIRATSSHERVLLSDLVAEAEERVTHAQVAEAEASERWADRWTAAIRSANPWRVAYTAHTGSAPDDTNPLLARAASSAALLGPLETEMVDLFRAAHRVAIHHSGGKDGLVAMLRAVQTADRAGTRDKLVVLHSNLGEHAEWPGVDDLVRRHAEHFGLELRVVEPVGGMLGLVKDRGKFPDSARRLCTAKLKRDALAPMRSELIRELKEEGKLGPGERPILIDVYGLRAEESAARRLKAPLSVDPRASSSRRTVLVWNAVHALTADEIWQEIADQGLEYHEVYDAQSRRLSCIFCVIAGVPSLVTSARICFAMGLEAPQVWAALEAEIQHTIKKGVSLAEILDKARRLDEEEGPLTWSRGDEIRRRLGDEAAAQYLRRLDLTA
ncbi:phosphoadenosine phosphosulfate reductase domain-containing protein [Streptomyces xiamenensis]|uniref:phosphoadenosine phosphosulfate reductase domain-containing protein n=1 Tax=Streptomyces xiamenensis TaxID=408015 RepID=UPI0035DDBDCE